MIFNIAIIVLCVILDQVSKMLAVTYLTDISTFPIIEDFLHFTYLENKGAAFGMLADNRWVFMILSVVGIIALFVWQSINRRDIMWNRVALSFIIGGGIGNMIDRTFVGYVVDFLDFIIWYDKAGKPYHFATFNIEFFPAIVVQRETPLNAKNSKSS